MEKKKKEVHVGGESLIIYRPVSHFRSTTKPLIKERCGNGERSGVGMEQMRRMVRSVEMAWLSGLVC